MSANQWFRIAAVMAAFSSIGQVANCQSTLGFADCSGGASCNATPPAACAQNGACAQGGQCAQGCGQGGPCGQGGQCPQVCGKDCCFTPTWTAFGEYLMLRPRNEGVEYAVPINGPIAANQVPLQIGPTAVINPDFQSGFRAGFERTLSDCSSVVATYTYYNNEVTDGPVSVDVPFVLRSMVFHPSSFDAASDWAFGAAHERTRFDTVDLDFHKTIWSCDCSSIDYMIGTRYAHLAQEFDADFQDIIAASATTNVDFDGVGVRFGLDGKRALCGGFYIGAKANASLLGGEFRADYRQNDTNTPVVVSTSWKEARFLTILESELSIGWQSSSERIRIAAGYMVSDWWNAVKPSDYISSVQRNHYRGTDKIGDTSLIFDGLTAHVDFSW